MDWYSTVFELIDLRSFSNLWFWIALAVVWSTNAHWVIGVPFDLIQRAARQGGEAQQDLEDMVRISCNRLLYITSVAGLWLQGLSAAFLTSLAILGFWYGIEFAQALLLLMGPMMIVWSISIAAARRIRADALTGDALHRRLIRHRILTQAIGMVSIFVTAIWGMYQNMMIGGLGA